jgi:proline utilization trans-activator
VLRERLDKLGRGDENWETFFSLTTTLITTGIKSAVKTLQILSLEDTILDVFLPFDLEFIYAAALHLIMSSTLFPSSDAEEQRVAQAQAHTCLDNIISKGNKVAEVRKAELVFSSHCVANLLCIQSSEGYRR